MWPEEATLEDTMSELSGGNVGERWDTDDQGDHASTTALAITSEPSDGNDGTAHPADVDADDEGLGPGGGLRDEWDMMTSEEKVCYVEDAAVPLAWEGLQYSIIESGLSGREKHYCSVGEFVSTKSPMVS